MGVKGLTSYVKRNSFTLSERTDLRGKKLVIDGSCLGYHIIHLNERDSPCLCLSLGGNFKSFVLRFTEFIKVFMDCGIELFVVFDGMTPMEKFATTKSRRDSFAEVERREINLIALHGIVSNASAVQNCVSLPIFFTQCLIEVCQTLRISFIIAKYEADRNLALIARNRNFDAVLSNDSDFLIFDNPGFAPLWGLHISDKTITALIFDPRNLARHLHISPEHLPLLASLMGNDLVPEAQNFCHTRLLHPEMPWNLKRKRSKLIVKCVANYIQFKLRVGSIDLKSVCSDLCGPVNLPNKKNRKDKNIIRQNCSGRSESFFSLIQFSVQQYRLESSCCLEIWPDKWRNLSFFPNVLQAVNSNVFWGHVVHGDTCKSNVGAWLKLVDVRRNLFSAMSPINLECNIEEYIPVFGRIKKCKITYVGTGLLFEDISSKNFNEKIDICIKIMTLEEKFQDRNLNAKDFISLTFTLAIVQKFEIGISLVTVLACAASILLPPSALAEYCDCPCGCVCECDGDSGQEKSNLLGSEFVIQWGTFQVTIWHVNAIFHAVSLPDMAISPINLNPTLALRLFRRFHLLGSRHGDFDNWEFDVFKDAITQYSELNAICEFVCGAIEISPN